MLNNFPNKVRELFDRGGWMDDWEDGHNDANALHHICKRVSSSPYNAAPLNNKRNHMPEGRKDLPAIHDKKVERKYLQKTKMYLDSIGYEPTDQDIEFLEINKKMYEG